MLHIHKITQIGTFHENYCEDYAIYADIGQNRVLTAVMDGCTMGTESFFASALIGKLLRKISREFFYKEYASGTSPNLKDLRKAVIQKLFQNLVQLKNELQLEREELLSTIILGVVDIKEKNAELMAIGDGFIACNDHWIDIDQKNVPDYLGYHLKEEFENWYHQQEQLYSFSAIKELSISTDGIFTFDKFDKGHYPIVESNDIIQQLISEKDDLSNERMFHKKLSQIAEKWGLKPTDDLGIVRLSFPIESEAIY